MKRLYFLFISLILFNLTVAAQDLKPGFDPAEFVKVLHLSGAATDTATAKEHIRTYGAYHLVYVSPVVGMDNRWYLWLRNDEKEMVINLRGTTASSSSWVENFYAAMIPAVGTLKISDTNTFNYKFSDNPRAMVHVGWAVGIGSLMPTIEQKLHEYYKKGVKQIIITGHSQGAAMAFLLRTYIYYQQQAGILPKDLIIKTYCSGAPKPGNQYFAYDYEFITRGGWGYTIVSAADWVPEVPFSIQTVNDFNEVSPFTHAKKYIRKQKKFLLRLYLLHAFNQMDKPTHKARSRFKKYLGHRAGAIVVKKFMPGYQQPLYANSSNYARAGSPIILQPDSVYYNRFPNNTLDIFMHHNFNAYFYLMKKIYGVQ